MTDYIQKDRKKERKEANERCKQKRNTRMLATKTLRGGVFCAVVPTYMPCCKLIFMASLLVEWTAKMLLAFCCC